MISVPIVIFFVIIITIIMWFANLITWILIGESMFDFYKMPDEIVNKYMKL